MGERGLGRGLLSVFGEESIRMADGNQAIIPVTKIEPNAAQPRHIFEESALNRLADSIKRHGLITPIAVKALANGNYQIIAGERRWRACKIAGITEVPAVIIDADEKAVLELALIENLQREDLNPFEEAQGFKELISDFGMTQEEVAERVGKSRPAIANALRILELPKSIKNKVEDNTITIGHARALLAVSDENAMLEIVDIIAEQELSVRQTEALVKKNLAPPADTKEEKDEKKVDYAVQVSKSLSEHMGRKVVITQGKKKGKILLEYYGNDDLERLMEFLASGEFAKQDK